MKIDNIDVNMSTWARQAIKEGVIERLEKAIATTSDHTMKAIHQEQIEEIKKLAGTS